jgi:glutamyl-tRNA reductase
MNFVLIGASHKTAPVEVRERLAIPRNRLAEATESLLAAPGVREAMVLSTCNRVEFLAYQEPANADLREFMQNFFGVSAPELRPYLYEYRASEAVRHLFRVASSLDSLVVGEPQILGQVKDSYAVARSAGGIGSKLDPLLQQAFTVARKVRNQTDIGMSSVSIASVAVDLARTIFGSLKGKTVLLMGAGKMGELAARNLMHQGASHIYVCNRNDERAWTLAEKFVCNHPSSSVEVAKAAEPIAYRDLHRYAATADIVVTCTGSKAPIFLPEHARAYSQERKQRPMFFIDIAMPRDVAPEVNRIEGIFVYNIDDLQSAAASNLSSRARAAQEAEAIIREEVDRYSRQMQALDGVPSIVALQRAFEGTRQREIRRAAPRLEGLSSEQWEAVEQITRALVNKMQHAPIQAIKRAASEGDNATLSTIREVFDLDLFAPDSENAPEIAPASNVPVKNPEEREPHE